MMKLKKIISHLLALTLVAAYVPIGVYADDTMEVLSINDYYNTLGEHEYIVVDPASGITVDGNGSDWENYPFLTPTQTVGSDIQITLDIKTTWDEENFYIYAEVKDETYFPQIGGTYWKGDCIQLVLGSTEEYFGYEVGLNIDPATNEPYLTLPADKTAKADSIQRAVKRDENLYTYEISLPWDLHFEKRPDVFRFCLLAADNRGGDRHSMIIMSPGIHDAKYNYMYPFVVLRNDSTDVVSWIDGEASVNTREKHEYTINILNLKEEKNQKFAVKELGFDEEVNLPEQSWVKIPIEYDTGVDAKEVVFSIETDENAICFEKSVKIYPTYEIYADRIQKITDDLGRIDELIAVCGEQGIATDYEEVNANTVREFLTYIMEDFANKDTDRMEYTLSEMEKLNEQAYNSLKEYILGIKIPYDVPRYVKSGHLKINDGVFYGLTETSAGVQEERPVILVGYGHGDYNRKNFTKYTGVGGNYMQLEIGPNVYLKAAGPVPDWRGGTDQTIEQDETGNHYAHLTNNIKQGLPVYPNKKYRLSFEAWGNAEGSYLSFQDYGNTKGISVTKEKRLFEYETIAPKNGVITLHITSKGDLYLDNLKMVQIDENGNEVTDEDEVILNGDFEKTEPDTRFYCDYSGMLSIFDEIRTAGENNMLASLLLSPHYFPSWIYNDYPEAKKNGIRGWDPHTEVMQDFFYKIGYEMARVLKKIGGVNDICVHNEDRQPLYMDNKYLPYLHEWLKKHYDNDINALNENYGTEYSTFEEVPMPNGLERNSQTWDLAQCTDEFTATGRQAVIDGIRAAWPEINIHGKLQSETIFNTNINRFTQGVEPLGEGRLFGIHGMDGGVTYKSGMFVDDKFTGGSPLSAFMSYDYLTSDLPAPVLNTEDHIDTDNDPAPINEIGDHAARYMWEAAVHGRTASVVWTWDRKTADSPQKHARGHVNYRPDQMAKIGRTALDLNRLSKEIEALIKRERTVQILYSPASRNRDYLSLNTQAKVYDACAYSGQKPYFLTDGKYDNINHADILIVPAARYVTEQFLYDALEYIEAGGELVLLGDFCLEQNEYAKMHDVELVNKIREKSTIIPVEYVMDTSYNYVGVNAEAHIGDKSDITMSIYEVKDALMPIFEKHNLVKIKIIDPETGKTPEGVKIVYTEYNGKMLLDVSYFMLYGVTKRYKVLYNGEEISGMRELRSGKLITDSVVELEASMPQLLQFDLR